MLTEIGAKAAADGTEYDDKRSGGVSWNGNTMVKEYMQLIGKSARYDEALKLGAK